MKKIFTVLLLLFLPLALCVAEESISHYYELATQADKARDADKAIAYYEKVLEIGGNPLLEKYAHFALAGIYLEKGDRSKSLHHARKSLAISLKKKDGSTLSEDEKKRFARVDYASLDILNMTLETFGIYDELKDNLSRQLELISFFDESVQERYFIDCYLGYASYYLKIEDVEKSIMYAEKALSCLENSNIELDAEGFRLYEHRIYSVLFASYMNMGVKNKDKTKQIVKKIETDFGDEVGFLSLVASYYENVENNYQQAEMYYLRAFDIAKAEYEKGASSISGDILVSVSYDLAFFYLIHDNYEKLENILLSTRGIKKNWTTFDSLFVGNFLLAELWKHYAKTTNKEKAYVNYLKQIEQEFSLFESQVAKQEYAFKIKFAYEFLSSELEWLPVEYEEQKNEFKKRALSLGLSSMQDIQYQLPERRSEFMAKSVAFWYAATNFAIEQKDYDNAFYYSESLRSNGFLKEIGIKASLLVQGLTDEERERLYDLYMQIALDMQSLSERDDPKIRARMKQNMDALDVLKKQIGERIPQYKRLNNPTIVTAKEAQKWCGKKKAILEYVLWNPEYGNDVYGNMQSKGGLEFSSAMKAKQEPSRIKSYCLLITDNNTIAIPLDTDYDYTTGVKKLRKSLRVDSPKKAQNVSLDNTIDERKELYEKLIAPVLPYLPKKTKSLVIVPDGDLASVPFDILGDDSGKILGDRYSITFSPAISVSMTKDAKQKRSFSLLGVGDAIYESEGKAASKSLQEIGSSEKAKSEMAKDVTLGKYEEVASYLLRKHPDGWKNIHGTGKQLRDIKNKILSTKKVNLYMGKNASESRIKAMSNTGELASYTSIMFACHGDFDQNYPRASTLVFSETSGTLSDSSEDGYLTAEEIAVLKMDADFLNMSACLTGLSHKKRGDGMIGLFRSFIVAGADCVGATLWEVDDAATTDFMKAMYTKINLGMSYKEAYKKTKAEFRKLGGFTTPYFWAPFVLYE